MIRNTRATPTAPGEGLVMVQTPLTSLLEAGIGVGAFLELIRSGKLDAAGRTDRFDWDDDATGPDTKVGHDHPPAGLPTITGNVTWRRAAGKWSLDAAHCLMAKGMPEVHYWSCVGKGIAQVRFDGVLLPPAAVEAAAGRRLIDIVDHEHFRDPRIMVVSATSGGPYPGLPGPFAHTTGRPAMTQIRIVVPTVDHHDPMPPLRRDAT